MIDNSMRYALSLFTGKKGGKSGGGGGRVAQEAPNTLQSKAVLRVVEILSEGEIRGLVDGAKGIYFDDTPLQNPDGTYNFTGINFDTRPGTPDQTYIPGFASVEDEQAVGVKVMQATPVVRTISDANIDAVKVTIRLTALTNQDTTNGDLNGGKVEYKISVQPNGGSYIDAVDEVLEGKTVSAYERQYRIPLTGNAPWNIKVTRVTDDNEAANIQNDIYFSSFTKIIDQKLIYPDTALLAMEIDSSLFGNTLPTRSYVLDGLILQVPSNYDPDTREYTGVWDGTFQMAWTCNPAWVLYNLIINNTWGLGQYINALEVDKFAFYVIGQYCDELVDDGEGGQEPRYEFNGVIETQEDAIKVLQVVASTFRGMLYWGADATSGVITPTANSPRDPVKLFTPANTIDGMFNYSGTALEARHSVAYVTWNDPANNYKPAIEVVEHKESLQRYGYRKTDIVAFGCTSRGQAHRFGKWVLDSEATEGELCVWSVGLADADTRPGDIVKIADPDYAAVRLGGRIHSGTTSQLVLDSSVTIEAGQSYFIDIMMPDGSMESSEITNSPGTTTTVDLSPDLSTTPNPDTVWVITASNVAPRQFEIIGVKETKPQEFELTGHYYDPNKFARVEQDINLPTPSFTKIKTGPIDPPTNIQYVESLYQSGPSVKSKVTLSWEASPDSRVVLYQIEAKRPGGSNNFELVGQTPGVALDVDGTSDGTWSFRVRAFDALGNPSLYTTITDVTLSINNTPPADVTNFSIAPQNELSVLTWTGVTSLNLSHYEIRYNSALMGATWNSSIIIVEQVPRSATQITVPSRSGTYLIKAVSYPTATASSGNYSDNPALIITDVDFLLDYNFVASLQEDPDFLGVKTDTQVVLNNLELTTASLTTYNLYGEYIVNGTIDLGAVYTSRISIDIIASANTLTNDVDDWADVDLIADVDGADDGKWQIIPQVRTTANDPFFSSSNIFTFPKDFDNAAWTKTRASITPNAYVAPDGTTTMDFLKEDNTTSNSHLWTRNASVTSGETYPFGLFVKANGRSKCRLRFNGTGQTSQSVEFDLVAKTGTVREGSPTYKIEEYGDGVFFIGIIASAAATDTAAFSMFLQAAANSTTYNGDNTSGMYIWGGQLLEDADYYDPQWSIWVDLHIGDYNARGLQHKLILKSFDTNVTPSIETLIITVDMPDFIQEEQGITTLSGGSNIVFDFPFRNSNPAIAISAHDLETGDYYKITNQSESGFTIRFYNSSNAGISRTFDYVAKGYGATT